MIHIIGGGLAGCEAAWQAARAGQDVTLHEMRPVRPTLVHKTDGLAELVCSNSFRGDKLDNAVGLIKEEMRRLDSVVMDAATWDFNRTGGELDASVGTLSNMYFNSFIGRSGNVGIATLRFVADKAGSTQLTMSDAVDFPFGDEMGDVIPVSFSGANITVAVPEPSAALLLVAGLAGLAWRRRAG